MKIHEYQAKEILDEYGVPIPKGFLATTTEEAVAAYEKLGSDKVIVKAQVHAGGRGKGGGIKLAEGKEEVAMVASSILGMHLKTHQDPVGRLVSKIYIEEAAQIESEMYLSVVLDRAEGALCLIGSTEGGVEIEKIAEEDRVARLNNPPSLR